MNELILFYSPGACSLAIHAALEQAGAEYQAVNVDLRQKLQLEPEYLQLNPQGRVPTLVVDGRPLTEVVAIADYLDRRYPSAGLLPGDAMDRALAQAAIQRLSSDIHPLYRALWIPAWFSDSADAHDALRTTAARRLLAFYDELEQRLADGTWGPGTPAGFLALYTAVFLRWSAAIAPGGLGGHCESLRSRLAGHPPLARAMAREGVHLHGLRRLTD